MCNCSKICSTHGARCEGKSNHENGLTAKKNTFRVINPVGHHHLVTDGVSDYICEMLNRSDTSQRNRDYKRMNRKKPTRRRKR